LSDELAADASERPTIGALLSDLATDTRVFAEAEIVRFRVHGKRAAIAAAIVLALLIAAVSLLQGAVIALLIGLILWFQPTLGTGWSVIAVVVATTIFGITLGWIGARRARGIVPRRKQT
jgi:VIT1/CCC1 family predicted Fe2+/Mn2+ transporter